TPFEQMRLFQCGSGGGTYALFADCDKWELAQWLIKNIYQKATEEFLKLPIVSVCSVWLFTDFQTQPFYHSNYIFLKLVDKLPTGPEWSCKLVQIYGDAGPIDNNPLKGKSNSEELELWMQNSITCVQELI
ncbi:hypothetical protein HD554DRAFT_1990105, partial [Boletus coccyginus]